MSHGDNLPWELVDGTARFLRDEGLSAEALHARSEIAVAAWRRLVRALYRIRRLQRIWGLLGQFLQTFPKGLRDQLLDKFPKQK